MTQNPYDEAYFDMLRTVMNGQRRENRTGIDTFATFGGEWRFDLQQGFPLLTTKKMHFKSIFVELLWFLRGDTSAQWLIDRGVGIWTANAKAFYTQNGLPLEDFEGSRPRDWAPVAVGDLGPVYGAQMRRWLDTSGPAMEIPIRTGPEDGPADLPVFDRQEFDSSDPFCGPKGRFTVLRKVSGGKNSVYLCQFEGSGSLVEASRPNIRRDQVSDPYELTVHGVACKGVPSRPYHRREYDLWYNMISRSYQQDHPSYSYYGAEGVYVSPRWKVFQFFLEDLSSLPGYEQWRRDPSGWHMDKDYYGSGCYSRSTVVFLPSHENQKYGSNPSPVRVRLPEGGEIGFVSVADAAESLGLEGRRISDCLTKVRGSDQYQGHRFSRWEASEGHVIRYRRYVDQLQGAVDLLRDNPDSRRIIVSSWNPGEIGKMALPPCHCFFQMNSRPLGEDQLRDQLFEIAPEHQPWAGPQIEHSDYEELLSLCEEHGVPTRALDLKLHQRSADVFLGVPFNIASYALLTMILAQITNHVPGEFIHSFGDLHIYENHLEQATEQLSRDPFPAPRVEIDPSLTELDDFVSPDAFTVVGYDHHSAIKAKMAV